MVGSLRKTSFVRFVKLFTAHENLIVSQIGELKQEKFSAIITAITKLFEEEWSIYATLIDERLLMKDDLWNGEPMDWKSRQLADRLSNEKTKNEKLRSQFRSTQDIIDST